MISLTWVLNCINCVLCPSFIPHSSAACNPWRQAQRAPPRHGRRAGLGSACADCGRDAAGPARVLLNRSSSLGVDRQRDAVDAATVDEADVGAAAGRRREMQCMCGRGRGSCWECPGQAARGRTIHPGPPCPACFLPQAPHRLSPMQIWLMPDMSSFWCCAGTPVAAASLARISALPAPGSRSMLTSCPHVRWLVRILT